MAASIAWYLGLLLVGVGGVCVLRPVRWLRVPTRRRALWLMVTGVTLAAISLVASGREQRIATRTTLLDQFVPVFQFNEEHAIEVSAPAERTYAAVFEVTPEEITAYGLLTWIRRFGRSGNPSILNPPAGRPLLETAMRTSFRKLAEQPGQELVLGTFVAAPASAIGRKWTGEAFATLDEPGFVKAAMNFRVEASGSTRSLLRTETRVHATDARTRRLFTPYWRTIYPGSAIIRMSWLRAIKTRAESGSVR